MFKKILALLSKEDRKSGILVAAVVTILALLEVLGAASIMPLLVLLATPDSITENSVTKVLYLYFQKLGVEGYNEFVVTLLALFMIITILIFLMRSFSAYKLSLFIEQTRYSLSSRLLESYLSQNYDYFLSQNSSELSKNLLSEVDQVVGRIIHPIVNMTAQLIVACAILILLIAINPIIAFSTIGLIGALFISAYMIARRPLSRIGQERLINNKLRFIFAGEIFGGIKAIKVMEKEQYSIRQFQHPSYKFSMSNAKQGVISQIPSYLTETIAIGGLIIFIFFNFINESPALFGEIVPILGLYAFSFYKLKPAANSIFIGFAGIKYASKSVDKLHADLSIQQPQYSDDLKDTKIVIHNQIELKDVSFCYNGSTNQALSGVNCTIQAGSSVGLVGSTGSGKTTLTCILLGLIAPSDGEILLDEILLDKSNVRAWQRNIGYVPQDIYLIDASVAENIAFGIPKDEIDYSSVERSARAANVADFIENKLNDSYQTIVGDRGVRLSGGEKQRIGIARALYTDPDILILDEATSALDTLTEKKIIEEVSMLSQRKTVIMVAHRLSTVKNCDKIIVLKDGVIETSGTYNELETYENSLKSMISA
jgi:ABC-type bacteriocin/lantibiotic exporter with double-glycine peptidase domain